MGCRRPSFHAELAREQVTAMFADEPIVNPVGNDDQDAQGNARIIVPPGVPAVPYRMGLATPRSTLYAWRENPECVECLGRIGAAEQAALVITPEKARRVAHREPCFVRAIAKFNPTFSGDAVPLDRRELVNGPENGAPVAAADLRLVPDSTETAE